MNNQEKQKQFERQFQLQQIAEEPNSRKRTHSINNNDNTPPMRNLYNNSSSSSSSSSNSFIMNHHHKKKRSNYSSGSSSSSSLNTTTKPMPLTPPPPRLTAQRSVPAFLNKLYNMVEDISTNDLIRWSKDGSSFIVEKHEDFAKTVLPRFYKHNTFASFVRQLNMYDFHKVPHLQQGVLISENEHDIWEFSNPHFQQNRPDLLILVTRKRNRDSSNKEILMDSENINLSSLIKDLNLIKKHQSTISSDLTELHRDNEILWQETLNSREKYQRHQEVIEKILQFLTAIFANDSLALTMNNTDMLPKGLIEEAASLAGISTNKINVNKQQQINSNLATSALSNILSSVIKLYSTTTPKYQPESPKELPNNQQNLQNFSKTLNTATRSAQSITQDIDMLQVNIETLANNLGIDPNQLNDIDSQQYSMGNKKMFNTSTNPNFVELNDEEEDFEEEEEEEIDVNYYQSQVQFNPNDMINNPFIFYNNNEDNYDNT